MKNVMRPVVFLTAAAMLLTTTAEAGSGEKISRPGRYEGYSPVLYNGWKLSSLYVPVRDGTRLAVDVIRPTRDGVAVEDRLPVLWMHTPYNRRQKGEESAAKTYPSGPIDLVKYGYVIAVADFRGLYGSFGHNRLYNFGNFVAPAWTDAYDITEWLAKQPWSSGKVGMWGCSATGGSQQQAAYTQPPSLKAIFPLSSNFDAYDFLNLGGVPTPIPSASVGNAERDAKASPVDGPDGPSLLQEAVAGHTDDPTNQSDGLPWRNSRVPALGEWWRRSSAYPYLADVASAGIAVYTGANWDEGVTKVAPLLLFANLPKERAKLIIGPQQHCRWSDVAAENGLTIQTEQLRFFDYWLKGIDNGVMEEPAVTYYTYNAPEGEGWRQSTSWPLANEQRTVFYLGQEVLSRSKPPEQGQDDAQIGEPARTNKVTIEPDPTTGLNYESTPLERDTEVTGYPVVKLWIDSETPDADVVAQLLDVAPDGSTRTYQWVGRLRASHRALGEAPYNNLGLPYHTHLEKDVRPLTPGTPAQLEFALFPMSYIFPQGHRIRVVFSFSNPNGREGKVAVLTGGAKSSSITLPVIPPQQAMTESR